MTPAHRRIAATTSLTALGLATASGAFAAPIDANDYSQNWIQVGNTVWCTYGSPFYIDEAAVFASAPVIDPATAGNECYQPAQNTDAYDGYWMLSVEDPETTTDVWYGAEDGTASFMVDRTTTAEGDVVLQGPVQTLTAGLDVSVQQRYYAAGDLARVLASFTNTTGAPLTVVTDTYGNLGSDSSTELLGDSSGDAAADATDRWIVTGDNAGNDPVVTSIASGPDAGMAHSALALTADDLDTTQELTIPARDTVHLAYFTTVTGWVGDSPDSAANYDAAAAAAIAAAAEFNSFSGRLTAGIPADALVLNWETAVPLPETEAFVTKVYNDLFGRDPEPAGLDAWVAALQAGAPYGDVANGITYSDEFRATMIRGAYQTYLGREPDAAGAAAWLEAMRNGATIQHIESGFIASDEYYAAVGGTDGDWVQALYAEILHRSASDAEVQAWTDALADGASRQKVAMGFLVSYENLTAEVDSYYQYLLGRSIDPEGGHNWVIAIQSGARVEQIIAGIVASAEYRSNL